MLINIGIICLMSHRRSDLQYERNININIKFAAVYIY